MGRYRDDEDEDPLHDLKMKAIGVLFSAIASCTVNMIKDHETPLEASERPAAVVVLRARSRKSCLELDSPKATKTYEQRFNELMKQTHVTTLQTLVKEDVTVCLDMRLSHQDGGIFDKAAWGTYYPEDNILSVYDTGTDFTSLTHGEDVLEKFSETRIDKNSVSYAGIYSCGDDCTEIRWKSAAKFDADTLAKNPWMGISPLKLQAEPELAQ